MIEKKEKKLIQPLYSKKLFLSLKDDKLLLNSQTIQTSTSKADYFKTVKNYYKLISSNDNYSSIDIGLANCFAVRLARLVINVIGSKTLNLIDDNMFPVDFYNYCLKTISGTDISKEIGDKELQLIFLKQIVHIMRTGGIIACSDGIALIQKKDISDESLFIKLFFSLWNEVEWEDIFPSDLVAARELKRNRNILIDLLLMNYKKFQLDMLANEFFELTGFSKKDDLLFISFLDFYFFTWLRHFGIIRYYNNSYNAPVYIELTDAGRRLLNNMR